MRFIPKNLVFKRSYFACVKERTLMRVVWGLILTIAVAIIMVKVSFHARRNLRGSNSPRNWGRTGGDVLCDTAVLHSGHIQRLNTHQ